jgi:hypothetical protein
MDHNDAIQLMATEKYLLNELSPNLRDEFEGHLFGCHECAMDVRAASAFLERGKVALADSAVTAVPVRIQPRPGLFAWLRPAFAVPAMAALLLVTGYQNFVTFPALKGALAENRAPHLATITPPIRSISRGPSDAPVVEIPEGKPFDLPLEIQPQDQDAPPQTRFQSYRVELHNPANGVEWSLTDSAEAMRKSPLITSPGVSKPGLYRVVVLGLNAKGEKSSVLETYFNFQFAPKANP